jgi:hypothetical protein
MASSPAMSSRCVPELPIQSRFAAGSESGLCRGRKDIALIYCAQLQDLLANGDATPQLLTAAGAAKQVPKFSHT